MIIYPTCGDVEGWPGGDCCCRKVCRRGGAARPPPPPGKTPITPSTEGKIVAWYMQVPPPLPPGSPNFVRCTEKKNASGRGSKRKPQTWMLLYNKKGEEERKRKLFTTQGLVPHSWTGGHVNVGGGGKLGDWRGKGEKVRKEGWWGRKSTPNPRSKRGGAANTPPPPAPPGEIPMCSVPAFCMDATGYGLESEDYGHA